MASYSDDKLKIEFTEINTIGDLYVQSHLSLASCKCKTTENSRETWRQAAQKILHLKYGKLLYVCSVP